MKEVDVILALLPQANGTMKRRPAIVLREMPPFKDFLICGVISQLYHEVENFDELITPSNADFVSSGLKTESLIRLGFLTVLSRQDIIGSIGSVSAERHRRLLEKLSRYLTD
ncbi:MAG: transcriptional regulator [Acidobacteria bacterium]|nr:transcriptional regulator [Acidobacteriota bacterium]